MTCHKGRIGEDTPVSAQTVGRERTLEISDIDDFDEVIEIHASCGCRIFQYGAFYINTVTVVYGREQVKMRGSDTAADGVIPQSLIVKGCGMLEGTAVYICFIRFEQLDADNDRRINKHHCKQ